MEMEQRNSDAVERNGMNSAESMAIREIRMLRNVTTADEMVRSVTASKTNARGLTRAQMKAIRESRRQALSRQSSVWQGQLKLKAIPIEMQVLVIEGNESLVKECFPDNDSILEMNRKLAFSESVQEKLRRRQMVPDDYCLLVGIPHGSIKCSNKFKLERYLETNNAIGVYLKYGAQSTFLLHLLTNEMFCESRLRKSEQVIDFVKRIDGIIFVILRPISRLTY